MTKNLLMAGAENPNTVLTVVALLAVFGLPVLMVWLTKKIKFFRIIGAVALCYALGFIFSLSGLNYDKALIETVASVLVCIAIPLVLFCFDFKSIRTLAKKTALSFGLVCISAVIVATSAFFITRNILPDAAGLSAMSVGLYIGGTPNLIAIGSALLGSENSAIVLANTADLFVGGIYFLFLLTVAKPVYGFFLDGKKRGKKQGKENSEILNSIDRATEKDSDEENAKEETSKGNKADSVTLTAASEPETSAVVNEYDFSVVEKKDRGIWKLVGAIALAIACFGVGLALEILINGNISGSLFILISVSVLGIGFSFVKPIRKIKGTYQSGQYLILCFSLALSMSMDMSKLVKEILPVLLFFACLQVGSILIHIVLCKFFRIDSDTALITSTAGIYGPPFITPVANTVKRNDLIAPGIICATLGLALGNFIGIGMGELFLLFS